MNRTDLLTHLWEFQNKFGFLSDIAVAEIAQELKVSKIEIEGVISFYHFFHRQPTRKYIIYLNNSIVSEFKGFQHIKAAFEKETGSTFGEYTQNSEFSLFETPCIGLSDQEPAALINFNPFTNLTVKKVKTIVQQLKNGIDLKSIASNPTSKIQYIPSEDKTIIFRNYKTGIALSKLKQKNPTEVLNIITKSELSGRGGAFFPTAKKWLACKESKSVKKYIICNADEGEPGTFKDKSVIENMPGLLIEGMIIAAYITGAKEGFIYLRAEYKFLQKKLENTLEDFYQNTFLGKNICGIKNFDFNIKIQLGAGSYVCGEEKALIESLEGKRGEPRVQKYFPTEFGYLGHSTVVNNVETFAKAARIVELGSNFISTVGTDISKGTKLLSISGDVAKPGIYEIEWGMSVRQLLKLCEALSPYYVQISGPSGECINSSEFDRQICEEDLVCGGSIMVFNRSRSILQIQENFLKFFKMESCGVCTPCRAGNQILLEKVKKFERGLCTQKDIDEIKQWGKIIKLSSRCGLGKSSPNSLLMSLDKFEDYFKQKISPARENHTIEFDMERAIQEYDSIIKETQL